MNHHTEDSRFLNESMMCMKTLTVLYVFIEAVIMAEFTFSIKFNTIKLHDLKRERRAIFH